MLLMIIPDEEPISWNKFYSGMHWGARRREAKRVHELIEVYVRQERAHGSLPPLPLSPVVLQFTAYYRKRARDASNVCVKLYEDGLVRAGVIPGDSPRYVRGVCTRSLRDALNPRLEILVEEITSHDDDKEVSHGNRYNSRGRGWLSNRD